jgi:phosphate starvation-inducible protein PhoH
MEEHKRLTRKDKRILRQNGKGVQPNTLQKINYTLKTIDPLTENQKLSFEAFRNNKNLMLHGIAGTGKSFISLYLALEQVLGENSQYKKIVIVRSVVPTRDMGFLPGSPKEKAKVYEAPYYAICTELFGRGDSYEYLKNINKIEFISTSFIRGITLNDCIVIVDEIANLTGHELDSVVTRIGKNCRIMFCGDFRQSDFSKDQEKNGLMDFMKVIQRMKSFTFIDFQKEDIVRSSLVKSYIIEKDRLGLSF